jgi:hypothetical protein
MLSKYVPPQKLQIEFLNKWRNADKYPKTDIFAPAGFNFDYLFAITMMAQPLAWFEGSGLPEEGFEIAPVIRKYREVQHELHAGYIFPIGDEPSGASWTGFQSINGDSGYFLIFRENNEGFKAKIKTYLPGKTEVKLEKVLGSGSSFIQKTDDDGRIDFFLPEKNSYVLYKYQMKCLRPIGNVLKFS